MIARDFTEFVHNNKMTQLTKKHWKTDKIAGVGVRIINVFYANRLALIIKITQICRATKLMEIGIEPH